MNGRRKVRKAILAFAVMQALIVTPVNAAHQVDDAMDDQSGATTYAEAVAVEDRVGDELLEDPGVVGTGVGVGDDGDAHLLVLVVDASDAEQIPGSIDGVTTEILVTGVIRGLDCPNGAKAFCDRPVPPGVSVGHPNITAGTLGALVKDAAGNRFALSNNHVLADGNMASIGDPILQPGRTDGGSAADPTHVVGTLSDFHPIAYCPSGNCSGAQANTMDAAIAAVAGNVQAENICGWSPQATTVSPGSLDGGETALKKCGRTTGFTTGTFLFANMTVTVQLSHGLALFTNAIITTDMADGGDSGSLMVDTQNRPVALLFAGSPTFTIGIPIDPILSRFGVSIDDGSKPPPPPNEPPEASFTVSCTDLTCNFDASASRDLDGTITSHAWDFGDGTSGSGIEPSHTYSTAEDYTVTLIVTDDDNTKDSTSRVATPSEPPPTPVSPSGSFLDDDDNIHETNIEAIRAARITFGCNPPVNDRYCPRAMVTRGQMAAFIDRGFKLSETVIDFFTDDDRSIFEPAINRLAAAEVTRGCNPPVNDHYCPTHHITRGEMAAFLDRVLGPLGEEPPDFFVDDDDSSFEDAINRIAARHVTMGCNPPANDRYCPEDHVTRDEMASFLARALGLEPITTG